MKFTDDSQILVQGIAEPIGATYVPLMQAYGTPIVAGISPGQGDQNLYGIPVFELVEQAIAAVGPIDATIICTQPYLALDAALEAIAAGIRQIVLISEGIPPLDMVQLLREAEATDTLVIGPNSPGLIIPDKLLLGTHPGACYQSGSIGMISRSSTLTFEVAAVLSEAKLGQSICVGLGSDALIGSTFPQWLQLLEEDDQTEAIVLIGETGGDNEEQAAAYIQSAVSKPVVAYLAGRHLPQGTYIGHLGAIMSAQSIGDTSLPQIPDSPVGSAESKLAAFKSAQVPVAERLSQLPDLVQKALKQKQPAASGANRSSRSSSSRSSSSRSSSSRSSSSRSSRSRRSSSSGSSNSSSSSSSSSSTSSGSSSGNSSDA
jgi:succinyl-CoA synthetase alpha subunit